jgi:cation-transporting P-type ATPase J
MPRDGYAPHEPSAPTGCSSTTNDTCSQSSASTPPITTGIAHTSPASNDHLTKITKPTFRWTCQSSVILVRPGERIGADGQVLDGASEVDQASITGEPLPVTKVAGDEVFAGTLNGPGALRVRVGRAASDTVVARIVAMVAEASATKARTQLFIEKVEQRYSTGMVAATVLLLAIPLLAGAAFQPALLRAMTFMIVASPCAVVLATMPPLLASIANAGRHRVLVKSAVVMEQAGSTTRVAFDKTGTLTEGTPRLAEIQVLPGAGLDRDEVLALAGAAENPSEHPLGRAVVAAAREAGLPLAYAEEFTAVPGRAARRLAAQVGIRDVRAGLLPQDKATAVTRLQAGGDRVLLAGDGVNDAPALAAAHTGVAMGRVGSDLALDTADAVIMRDDLATIAAIITLSRRARRVITANLVIAATIIAALVIWDLAGHLPLPLGVAGHEGSTVIVGLNGLRLLRGSAWRKALNGGQTQ